MHFGIFSNKKHETIEKNLKKYYDLLLMFFIWEDAKMCIFILVYFFKLALSSSLSSLLKPSNLNLSLRIQTQ